MSARLGSRHMRVLHAIRWAFREWGPVEVGFNVETLKSSLPLRVDGVTPRECYRVAERLEELGLVEIDREAGTVRPVPDPDG